MMMCGAQKGDAGSEVSLQSCDQTQSRRNTHNTDSFFKFNEHVMHLNTNGLADKATVANFATAQDPSVNAESAITARYRSVRNFRIVHTVCAKFAHTAKLSAFFRLSERDILANAGKISNKAALDHANAEFDKFRQQQLTAPSVAEKDFEKSLKKLEQIESTAKKKGGK